MIGKKEKYKKLILASASPRRKELLERIHADFDIVVSEADETFDPALPPHLIVEELSLLKAMSVAKIVGKGHFVIGADTIVVKDGQILGKPHTDNRAEEMLNMLNGTTHEVLTGITVVNTNNLESISDYEKTLVKFRQISDDEIKSYIHTKEPLDKAGAYGIQDIGGIFVERIEGDYQNVVGLPVCKLCNILKEHFNFSIL